jgi:hypothetical protein
MKEKIKILDNNFSHSVLGYCSDFQVSENFEWDRNESKNEDILVITDNFLVHDLPINKNAIAWLIEPKCISPNTYEYVKNDYSKFDVILTHEKTLLDSISNTKFVSFGGCWISTEEQKIHTKCKNISTIMSNKNDTEGQKLRHDVIKKLGDKIDKYGRTHTPILKKIEGLKDYRFSLVIENCKRDYWFTEKLIDCFMTGTIPIYWGCPSIGEFFNTDGMIIFDKIEELELILENCNEELYYSKLDIIKENFEKSKNYLLPDEHVYKLIKKFYTN